MIKRTIKPAAGSSRVSAEAATAAARLVYRDWKTGRFVILDGERSDRRSDRAAKRVLTRIYPRAAKLAKSGRSSSPSAAAKKR